MNLTLPHTSRPLAVFAAVAWTTLSFGAALAPSPAAAGEGAFYRAQIATPAPAATQVAGGLVWKCAETVCAAGKGTSRPAIVCARLAKQVGPVAAFTAGGKVLEAAELARCNGK